MRYLHTMVRIHNVNESLAFYQEVLGLRKIRSHENEKGRFTLIFMAAPADEHSAKTHKAPLIELTYNWDPEPYTGGRNFGHLAFEVKNIYDFCSQAQTLGVVINRPPRDGRMAFIKSPEGISIELLQKGDPLPPQEPWLSMPNTGTW